MLPDGDQAKNAEANDRAIDAIFSMFDESSATEFFMVEQSLLGSIHGAGLQLGNPTMVRSEVVGPIGTAALKVKLTLSLGSWDATRNIAKASMEIIPDQTSLMSYMRQVLPTLVSRFGAFDRYRRTTSRRRLRL
jgi:hypothetical protein